MPVDVDWACPKPLTGPCCHGNENLGFYIEQMKLLYGLQQNDWTDTVFDRT